MTGLRHPGHVVILGSGAMGCLFGGILSRGGLNVTLVDVWEEHVQAIRRNGLRFEGHLAGAPIRLPATTDVDSVPPADIVSVQCKAMDTRAAVSSAAGLFHEGTVAVSFQNGIGNEQVIASVLGPGRVLGGWTAHGASVRAPGVVFTYAGQPSHVGEMLGGISRRARDIAAALSEAGLPTRADADIVRGMWKKMMINIGLSAPSAFTGLSIRRTAAAPGMREVIQAALAEAEAVARAAGVRVSAAEGGRLLDALVGPGGTGNNRSSLCEDVRKRRPTEIDYINGTVVRLGRRFGIPTPVNATFVAAVKGLESGYSKSGPAP